MAGKLLADVVAAIPYPGGTRYQKVGALLQMENNDQSKGPGFVIMIDRYFNPAGVPSRNGVGDQSSLALSTYWPKDQRDPSLLKPKPHRPTHEGPDLDDDIPF